MATTVVIEEQVEIPTDIQSLADFRRWALSDDFPERGRIDYLAGRIEVDMAPESFFCHGTLKVEISSVLARLIKRGKLGYVVTDCTRVSSVPGDLSAEPDIVFISHESLAEGRACLIPGASGRTGHYVEVEGAPDLIVEIVSDSSAAKDTRRLPKAYFKAGVREFWLADARREPLAFRIHCRGRSSFRAAQRDAEGFQRSEVFGRRFRLEGHLDAEGHWAFDLLHRD